MTDYITWCFACKEQFKSVDDLKVHMGTCKAAAESLNVKPLGEAVQDVMDALNKPGENDAN